MKIETGRKLTFLILCGMVFGYVMQKSQVFAPNNISQQFTFENQLMLKMFLTSLVFSWVALIILSMTNYEFMHGTRDRCVPGVLRTGLGCTSLGAGMWLAGSCPGNMWVQVGAQVPNIFYTSLGCVIGNVIYFLVQDVFGVIIEPCDPIFKYAEDKSEENAKINIEVENITDKSIYELKNNEIELNKSPVVTNKYIADPDCGCAAVAYYENTDLIFLDKYLDISYCYLAAPFVLVTIAFLTVLEIYIPYESEFIPENRWDWTNLNPFTQRSWPPYLVGAIVGLLQIPYRHITYTGLGSSTAIYSLLASIYHLFGYENKQSMFIKEGKWMQMAYILIGVVFGGYLGALSGGQLNNAYLIPGNLPVNCVIGGILMYLGARIADGCTSGHGLTGCANLNIYSMIGTAFIFAGGIIPAMTLKYAFGITY